ncbi:MAG: hypothetical protein ACJ8F7_18120 [Gemmataceae bacterium]
MRQLIGYFFAALFVAPSARADKIVLVAGGDMAKLESPFGVAFDKGSHCYVVEMTANRIGRLDADDYRILVGTGRKGDRGDGGAAAQAELNGPHHFLVGPDGSVFIADTWNNRVRKFDPKTGVITPFAGAGETGFAGDGGPAAGAKFGGVYCLALDNHGERMVVADLDNRRIRAIDLKTGTVSTVAGNGQKGIPADGAEATKAPLLDPRAVAVDDKGNLYILERAGNVLRIVDAAGKIRTVVGTGEKGFSGDGGDALKAKLNGPKHLCIDRDGGVLIADTENHVIRKYSPETGQIVRVAGTGKKGSAGVGGPADTCELNQPHGVYLHPSGDIYISDSSNNRILRIERGK